MNSILDPRLFPWLPSPNILAYIAPDYQSTLPPQLKQPYVYVYPQTGSHNAVQYHTVPRS